MFNVSYLFFFFSNQEKEDGFCLKMIDQIKKFLFNTISKTLFPVTRAPVLIQFQSLKMLLIKCPALIRKNVVTKILPNIKTFSDTSLSEKSHRKVFSKIVVL